MNTSNSDHNDNSGQLQIGGGVPNGWMGHLSTFCYFCGLSASTRDALVRSLKAEGDRGFIEINNQQRFITAEAGFRHLAKLAGD